MVFAPHVETSAGMLLPDDYIRAVADAVHAVDGLFVLDGVASGTIWVDMEACGVDIPRSAPTKGLERLTLQRSRHAERSCTRKNRNHDQHQLCVRPPLSGFKSWKLYEKGGHAYHATMPTDSLRRLRDMMKEAEAYGFDQLREAQRELGDKVRALLVSKGIKSVAAEGFQAPGVIVSYTEDGGIQNGKKFLGAGLQIAAGVPLKCDEPEDFQSFRLGLFGLDKLQNVDRTVENLDEALRQIL